MPHAGDAYALGFIVDNIDHAPVTNPQTPVIFETLEFLAPGRSGILGQYDYLAVNPGEKRIVKRVKLFRADSLISRL